MTILLSEVLKNQRIATTKSNHMNEMRLQCCTYNFQQFTRLHLVLLSWNFPPNCTLVHSILISSNVGKIVAERVKRDCYVGKTTFQVWKTCRTITAKIINNKKLPEILLIWAELKCQMSTIRIRISSRQ